MWDVSILGFKFEYAPTFIMVENEIMQKIDAPDFDGLSYDDLKMLNSIMGAQTFGAFGSKLEPIEKAKVINSVLVSLNTVSEKVDYYDVLLRNMQNTVAQKANEAEGAVIKETEDQSTEE